MSAVAELTPSEDGDRKAFSGPVLGHLCVWLCCWVCGVPTHHTGTERHAVARGAAVEEEGSCVGERGAEGADRGAEGGNLCGTWE